MADQQQPPEQQTAVCVVKRAGENDDFNDVLSVVQQDVLETTDGEVLVNVYLRPINPADVYKVLGKLATPVPLPFNPGNEAVGKVVKNGPQTANRLQAGQRVVAASWPGHAGPAPNGRPFGTWQQYLTVPEKDLLPVPEDITDEDACQYLINPATAYAMVETLDVPEGGWLLQTAAGSVVGRNIIRLANRRGIRTINVVRRPEQRAELTALGADEVICSTEDDIVERVMQVTEGRGAYGATDAVGGKTSGELIKAVRKGGTVLIYGAMSGFKAEFDIGDVLYGGKTITGFAVLRWLPQQKAAGRWQAVADEIWEMFRRGIFQAPVGSVYSLEEVAAAVKESMRSGKGDKVLLRN